MWSDACCAIAILSAPIRKLDYPEKSLRWRCRRGMQELDTLLLSYLEKHYPDADAASRQSFMVLLQQPDDVLWDWLSGRIQCQDSELQALIDCIRRR